MDVWEIWLAGLVGIRILLMVPITAETAASLLRHLDKAGSAVVVVNLGSQGVDDRCRTVGLAAPTRQGRLRVAWRSWLRLRGTALVR